MFRRGFVKATIAKVLLDRANKISAKAYDEADPVAYVDRQIDKTREQISLASNEEDGKPYVTQDNIRLALLLLGVSVRYNQFADQTLIEGLDDFGPLLDDAALTRLRLTMDMRFGLFPGKMLFQEVVLDTARRNGFHPVREYLDGLRWDGVPRIDNWLSTYSGAESNEYTQAVSALMLVAAVRRIRSPGCKFDEIPVLEAEQGTGKSTSLRDLAINDGWFTDSFPLHISGKEAIENLRGKWIVEAAELSGMHRSDIEHVKALLSRQSDRGRLSYDRITSEVPRQCIFVGTTNSSEYLKDTTGNRRFWPASIKQFDREMLQRDRDQLWAEAAAREAQGVSIRLDPKLYPRAGEEQARRTTNDPYYEALQGVLGDMDGKISSLDVWEILDVKPGHRNQEQNRRMGDAMRLLGWDRANSAGTISAHGKNVMGWVRGDQPYRLVKVQRDLGGLSVVHEEEEDEHGNENTKKILLMSILEEKHKGNRTFVHLSRGGKSEWVSKTAIKIGSSQGNGKVEITMSTQMAKHWEGVPDQEPF